MGAKHKTDLLAIYDKGNTLAWAALDYQFNKDKPSDGFFSKPSERGSFIKWRCEDAYRQSETGTDDTKPKEDDLYKWCSLKGKKASS